MVSSVAELVYRMQLIVIAGFEVLSFENVGGNLVTYMLYFGFYTNSHWTLNPALRGRLTELVQAASVSIKLRSVAAFTHPRLFKGYKASES